MTTDVQDYSLHRSMRLKYLPLMRISQKVCLDRLLRVQCNMRDCDFTPNCKTLGPNLSDIAQNGRYSE